MDATEKQIKRIVLDRMDRCAVCHHVFAPEEVHVISRRPDMWMMMVECGECHARNFVAAVLNDGDPDEAQVALRRLSQGEAHAPAEPVGPPVGVDDVLDMHDFLRDFDGDFLRLFRGR
jgi:hypothetical protein